MRKWFKEFGHSLSLEIKNTFHKSFFHFVRFTGLLLIPLLYGFSYVFAFWNPFAHMDKLPIAVVTKQGDVFGNAIGNALSQEHKTYIGTMKMTIKAKHIYYDQSDEKSGKFDPSKKNLNPYNAAFVIPAVSQSIYPQLQKIDQGSNNLVKTEGLVGFLQVFTNNPIDVINNFKKNYLIAFGLDLATAMSGTVNLMLEVFEEALKEPQFIQGYSQYLSTHSTTPFNPTSYNQVIKVLTEINRGQKNGLYHLVNQNTQMHEHATYGYGLAPFFISIAMWVGGMVLTFSIHRKIYDRKVRPAMRYFTKWLLITYGVVLQATILMLALYLIGFNKLGVSNWLSMYGFAIFSGLIFATIIQAFRFAIASKNIGIFLCIFLLILQMASAGGLFPIATQAKFYRVLNVLLPMGHAVNVYRELAYHTRWSYVLQQCGYLLIYPALILPIAIPLNFKLTKKFYLAQNWDLTPLLPRKSAGGKE